MSEPQPAAAPPQRFPSKRQAVVIFFGSIALSFTTCTTVLILFGEKQLDDTEGFLVALAVYVCFFLPVAGFVVLVMYFVRRRSNRREENAS